MFTNFRYKNLPERQVQEIITHCLTYSSNNEPHNFSMWHVGLTDDPNMSSLGDHFKLISCDSNEEAADLKRYLTTLRRFGHDSEGEGKLIYIFRQ